MIRKQFEFEITSPVCLCDVEISNDISNPKGEWFYEKSDIITLGIFYGNKITILQREKTDKLDFWKDTLRKELEDKPVMFAYNVLMEKGAIKGFIGMNRFFEEVKPAKGKGINKENVFNDLLNNDRIPKVRIIKDPLKGRSDLVQDKYAENKYEDIIIHNYNCLIKEYFILINRFWFLDRYKDKIKNGWWNDDVPYRG